MQRNGLEDGLQVMKAVGAPSGDMQRPVDLRVGADLHRAPFCHSLSVLRWSLVVVSWSLSVVRCPLIAGRPIATSDQRPQTTIYGQRRTDNDQRTTASSAPDYLRHRHFDLLLRARHLGVLGRVDGRI